MATEDKEVLNEDELEILAEAEAHLRGSLRIEPSPEFMARVRGRVDQERRRRSRAPLFILAAAAVVVAVIGLLARRPREVPPPVTVAAAPTVVATPEEPPPTAAPPVALRRQTKRALTPEPAVIVDPRGGAALAAFAQRRQGTRLESLVPLDDLPRVTAAGDPPPFEAKVLDSEGLVGPDRPELAVWHERSES